MSDTPASPEDRRAQLRRAALEYHESPVPGKVAIAATKQLLNQHDLSLAGESVPTGLQGCNQRIGSCGFVHFPIGL